MNLSQIKREAVDKTEKHFEKYKVVIDKAILFKSLDSEAKVAKESIEDYRALLEQRRLDKLREDVAFYYDEAFKGINVTTHFAYGTADQSVQSEIKTWCECCFWTLFHHKILVNPEQVLKHEAAIQGFTIETLAFQMQDLLSIPARQREIEREDRIEKYANVLAEEGLTLIRVSCLDRLDRLERIRPLIPTEKDFKIILHHCPCGYEFQNQSELEIQIAEIFNIAELLRPQIQDVFIQDFEQAFQKRISTYDMFELEVPFKTKWIQSKEKLNPIIPPNGLISETPIEKVQEPDFGRTRTFIEEEFRIFHPKGWEYAFKEKSDFDFFVNLLVNFFETKSFLPHNGVIILKPRTKTKLGPVLNDIYKECANSDALAGDKKFMSILKVLNHFSPMSNKDIYKVLTRNTA